MYVNKRFKPTDKIEFGLQARFRRDGYYIVYRFLPKKIRVRILWFYVNITIKDTWTVICLYNTDNNPFNIIDKDYYKYMMHCEILYPNDSKGVERYKKLREKIKTYEELDKEFGITENEKKYKELKRLKKI